MHGDGRFPRDGHISYKKIWRPTPSGVGSYDSRQAVGHMKLS